MKNLVVWGREGWIGCGGWINCCVVGRWMEEMRVVCRWNVILIWEWWCRNRSRRRLEVCCYCLWCNLGICFIYCLWVKVLLFWCGCSVRDWCCRCDWMVCVCVCWDGILEFECWGLMDLVLVGEFWSSCGFWMCCVVE